MKPVHEILIRPHFTERIAKRREIVNQYVFIVHKDANKIEIAKAVESHFGVKNKVLAVNTITMHGKVKRMGRYKGRRPDWKKAVITLAKGVVLTDIYDGV